VYGGRAIIGPLQPVGLHGSLERMICMWPPFGLASLSGARIPACVSYLNSRRDAHTERDIALVV
jgi:hypothetical protein